jgi:pimeloyl-ACP methyl ester carboxylesterase
MGNIECAVSGEGPAILLLHGAMGGYDQGLLLGRAAVGSSGYRSIAISRPGYLGTSLACGKTPEQQADLCAALLDALIVRQAAVIAISGGGQCALQFALRHPKRCSGLVMISACSAQINVRLPFRFHLMKWMARVPALVAAMRRKFAANPAEAARRSIADPDLRARTLDDTEAGPLMLALQLSAMDRMMQRMPGTENDIRQSRMPFDYPLEQISVPTLIVHGTADQAVPFEQARLLAYRMPVAELLPIQDGEHVSLFTHLHEIRVRVTQFLRLHLPTEVDSSVASSMKTQCAGEFQC